MAGKKKSAFFSNNSQLLIPLIAIILLVVFNLLRDPSFFSVSIASNNKGDPVLQGNLISILNGASELVILSMGMTLVTAASGGQDISVGALAAIAGSMFVKVLRASLSVHFWPAVPSPWSSAPLTAPWFRFSASSR